MKFRLITEHGDGVPLMDHIMNEGHTIDVWHVANGVEPEELVRGLTEEDVIVFDMVGHGVLADMLREDGWKVYGSCGFSDRLELDRQFALRLAKVAGLRIPDYEITLPEDTHFKNLPAGIEVGCEVFCQNGRVSLETVSVVTESPDAHTGYTHSMLRRIKPEEKLYRLGLGRMAGLLKKFKCDAPVRMNCLVFDKDKPLFLGFVSRLGYDSVLAICNQLGYEVGKFIQDMAAGNLLIPSGDIYNWHKAVRISTPPYSYGMRRSRPVFEECTRLHSLKNFVTTERTVAELNKLKYLEGINDGR